MTAGNRFLNRNEHVDENMSNVTIDPDMLANSDEKNTTRSISSAGYEILKQEIRTFSTGGESGSQLYKCEEVRVVCGVTQELSMKVLCIHVTSVSIRQQNRAI